MITIQKISSDKKKYLDLLLLADEQESMIDTYLEQGETFGLFDDDLKTICVAVDNHDGTCEIKNLATKPFYRLRFYFIITLQYVKYSRGKLERDFK